MNFSPNSIRSVVSFLFSSLLLVNLTVCASGQQEEPKKKAKLGPIQFVLKCTGNQAVRDHIKRKEGILKERGPVAMGGKTCKELLALDEKKIRPLKREGVWQTFYTSKKSAGKVQSKGLFTKNKREGEWLFYNTKGKRTKVVLYKNHKKEGPETFYFAGTNDWRTKGQNKANKKVGRWVTRSSVQGECNTEGEYKDGKKEGAWVECKQDPTSKKWFVAFQGSYLGGLKNKKTKMYFPNGKVQAEGAFLADLKCLENPPPDGEEACGKRNGKWVMYYSNGKKAMEGSYDGKSGLRAGNWTEYYQSGEKMGVGPRKHTRRGEWVFFDKKGVVIFKFVFKGNDVKPDTAMFFENGKKTSEGGLAQALLKFDAGNDSLKLTSVFKNGPWVFYDGSGEKISEGSYMMNKKHGAWREQENGRWVDNNYMLGKKKK